MATARVFLFFDPFHLDAEEDVLYRGEEVVRLEPQAVRVLRYLVVHRDRVVAKQELIEQLWPGTATTEGVVKRAVALVRRALGDDAADGRYLQTLHRRGYRFIAPLNPDGLGGSPSQPDFDQFVNRTAELAVLQSAYKAASGGEGGTVLVVGEAGAGKTRLARHFALWAEERGALRLYTRFFDYGGSRLAGYDLFLDLLRRCLETSEHDPVVDLRTMARIHCGVNLPAELFARWDTVHPFAEPARGDRFRAVVPIATCFLRLARRRPIVLVLDDLHWADDVERDVISCLARAAPSTTLLLVALARREEPESFPLKVVPLHPWTAEECAVAVGAVLGGAGGIPSDVVRMLHDLTGGNPYFLAETLRLLVADGAVVSEPSYFGWRWRGLTDLRLPDSILLAARAKLDVLSAELRELLDHAAVIGDEFRVDTLARMCRRDPDDVDRALRDAVRAGVLAERGLSEGEDYRFDHTVVRRAAYDALSQRNRRRLHGEAAAALEEAYRDNPERVAGAISVHYEAADEQAKTVGWSLAAWRAARRRWQWAEAATHLQRGERATLKLGGEPPPELLLGLGEAHALAGRLEASLSTLNKAIDAAERHGQRSVLAAALLQRSSTQCGLSVYEAASQSAERARTLFEDLRDEDAAGHSRVQWAAAQVALGNLADAEPSLRAVIEAAGSPSLVAAGSAMLGWALALAGRFDEGAAQLSRALGIHEGTGDLRRRALVLRRLHWIRLSQGRYEEAIDLARRAGDDFRATADASGEAKSWLGIGQARIAQGLHDEGLAFLRQTYDRMESIGDAHCQAETRWLMGRAHVEAGRMNEGLQHLDTALRRIQAIGDKDDLFRVLLDVARGMNASDQQDRALAALDEAGALAETLDNADGLGAILAERAVALLAKGRANEAQALAERSVVLLEGAGSGERWRGHWALGRVLEARGRLAEATEALRNSAFVLMAMRDQIDAADVERRSALTRARGEPIVDLARVLRRTGRTAEARAVRQAWSAR